MSSSLPVDAVRSLARLARLLEAASDELNPAHYRVLAAIASGDQRASRVADRLALGKPTVSAAVAALTERGLLSRGDDVRDRRAEALALTDAGEAVLGRVEAVRVARLDELCVRMPASVRALDALVELGKAVEEMRAARHRSGA